ncbi:MAG: hypothetical protein ABIY55_01485 [Kofleriaceae bacterium]
MLFRVLTTGLCAACVFLLATFPPVRVVVVQPASIRPAHVDRSPGLSVVDVAAGVAPASIPALVRLAPGEWIQAIDDQRPYDDFEADELIRAGARPGGFLDLTVAGRAIDRRVLLLIH